MYTQSPEAQQEEKELLIQLNQGEERAFEKLYNLYSIRVLKRLINLLKDEEIAKEVLQDVFMKIWEKREDLDAEKSFRSYLFQIAENRVTDLFRRAKTDRKLLDHIIHVSTELYHHTEDIINYKESNFILERAIESLPPRRKEIFKLCKIEGKTYEEVAQILDISMGTVNDHMVKALRSIRKHFSNQDIALIALFSVLFQQLK